MCYVARTPTNTNYLYSLCTQLTRVTNPRSISISWFEQPKNTLTCIFLRESTKPPPESRGADDLVQWRRNRPLEGVAHLTIQNALCSLFIYIFNFVFIFSCMFSYSPIYNPFSTLEEIVLDDCYSRVKFLYSCLIVVFLFFCPGNKI